MLVVRIMKVHAQCSVPNRLLTDSAGQALQSLSPNRPPTETPTPILQFLSPAIADRFLPILKRAVRLRSAMGQTLLHLACCDLDLSFRHDHTLTFPSLEFAAAFLDAGAYINAVGSRHCTPLLLAACMMSGHPISAMYQLKGNRGCAHPTWYGRNGYPEFLSSGCGVGRAMIEMLLGRGAHTDARDCWRRTAVKIVAAGRDARRGGPQLTEPPYMSTEMREALEASPTLQCLAARKIVERGVKYSGRVPASIEAFIAMH